MINHLLQKLLAEKYYRENTGFFLILVLVLFGLFTPKSHLDLANIAALSPVFLLLAYFLPWTLYTLKTLFYVSSQLKKEENSFFLAFRLFSVSSQIGAFVKVQFVLLQPVLFFALLILWRAFLLHGYASILLICLFLIAALFLPALFWLRQIRNPSDKSIGLSFRLPAFFRFPRGHSFYFLRKLLHHEPALFFITKMLSGFLLLGSIALIRTDSYDERLISLAILLAGFAHLGLSEIFYQFEWELPLLKNLPWTNGKRFSTQLFSWLPVLAPEFVMLWRSLPSEYGWIYWISAPFFLLSLPYFLSAFRFFSGEIQKNSERILPITFFGTGFAIMYKTPVLALAGIFLLTSFFLIQRYYLSSEPRVNLNAKVKMIL